MRKRILLCALVLGLMLSCAACGKTLLPEQTEESFETKPPKTEESTTEAPIEITLEPSEEDTTEESIQESTAPVSELLLPAEEQIAIFVANRELWYPVDDYYVPYSYTVCDLDQNGRLELLINICMGTGFFSENTAWEINESGDGIVSCGEIFETYESVVDLGYPEADAYYDAESGVYYYVAEDFIRNGWAFNATEMYALSLEDGQIRSQFLASYACETFEDGTQTITCTDASGADITEEEFNVIDETVFADLKPLTAKFLWKAEYMEDTDLLDADGWHRILEEAWQGFSLEEQ